MCKILKPNSFEPGAPAVSGSIPLCVPEIRGNEWKYIKECLDTNFVSSVGPFVERFERELAARVGAKYAVATVNGTSALHIALLIAGVKPDDEVLISTLTFIAPANAIRYAQAGTNAGNFRAGRISRHRVFAGNITSVVKHQ